MHRTTIELDESLIEQAKQVLGTTTIRATVEEALRRSIAAAMSERERHAERQREYLRHMAESVDLDVLISDEMWR
jgi:Arc/MetJ family transcription regulator